MRSLLIAVLAATAAAQSPMTGTRELIPEGDPAARMVDAIHTYLDRETVAARDRRAQRATPPDRDTFRKIIGAVDPRVPPDLRIQGTDPISRQPGYRAYAVRWQVFDDVEAEGLLLDPDTPARARVVAIPDPGIAPESFSLAQQLARAGCQVLIPTLIDRADTWSGIPGVRMTNQPHREWIYRMSFEAGRHIIGYEVQKVLAAVDWFKTETGSSPIGVAGEGEGGLIALYAAALDDRIAAALVTGYFGPRDQLWKEPIYRDIWGLLKDYGDAEIAALIAPRALIVDPHPAPEVAGPPPVTRDRRGAAPIGAVVTPPQDAVRAEVDRARRLNPRVQLGDRYDFANALDFLFPDTAPIADLRPNYDPAPRLHRQFDQLVAHTQAVIRRSPDVRAAQPITRDRVWNDVIGRLPDPTAPADPRTRLVFDQPKFRGYEVMLDVWPGVFAYGILLVPKDLKPGERRPVVVCQHGLEGRPRDLADPSVDKPTYHRLRASAWPKKASSPSPRRTPTSARTASARSSAKPTRSGSHSSPSSSASTSGSSNGSADCPSSTRTESASTASPTAARPPCAFRRCSMATPSPSAPPTSTSGSGRPPASIPSTATCSPRSTTCWSGTSPT